MAATAGGSGSGPLTGRKRKLGRGETAATPGNVSLPSSQESDVTEDNTTPKKPKRGRRAVKKEDTPVLTPVAKQTDNVATPSKSKSRRKPTTVSQRPQLPQPLDEPRVCKKEEVSDDEEDDDDDDTDDPEWTSEELQELLSQMRVQIPEADNVKYSTAAERLDWQQVTFGKFTAKQVKRKWMDISTKLRRFRTLTELLEDAREWAKAPWNAFGRKRARHPDMPKKPLTAYFKFFMDKRDKFARENPHLSMTELSKFIAAKFNSYPEKKKKKYLDVYAKEMEEYRSGLIRFQLQHPELAESEIQAKMSHGMMGRPKPTSSMMIYINTKIKEKQLEDPKASRKELFELYRTKWQKLQDNRKLKYIKKADEAKVKFDEQMGDYCEKHPEFKPREIKSFLTKAEQKIKDRLEGKPEKPPPNGYGLFSVAMMSSLTDIPSTQKMSEISRRWKALTQAQRDSHNAQAEQKNTTYMNDFVKYVEALPEDEQKKYAVELGKIQRKQNPSASPNGSASDRPQQPVNGMFVFINENKEHYQKKFPEMDHKEVMRFLIKEYSCLPEKVKTKYKKLADEQKQNFGGDVKPPKANKKLHFPGEPAKPPCSGYQLFSKEMLLKLTDVPANERMQAASERWAKLTAAEKKQYGKRKEKLVEKYQKELEKFKKGLSPKDLKKYEELHAKAPKKSHKRKVPEVKSASPPSTSSESESESEEEDDDDDDDDEEEEEEEGEGEEEEAEADGEENEEGESDSEEESGSEEASESESGSDSSEEEEEANDADKAVVQNGAVTKSQREKLSAKDVYVSSSSESSEESDSD